MICVCMYVRTWTSAVPLGLAELEQLHMESNTERSRHLFICLYCKFTIVLHSQNRAFMACRARAAT